MWKSRPGRMLAVCMRVYVRAMMSWIRELGRQSSVGWVGGVKLGGVGVGACMKGEKMRFQWRVDQTLVGV